MNHAVLFELDQYKKRLEYYQEQKTRLEATPAAKTKGTKAISPSASVDKFIEIYDERVKKLERQAMKLGLRTQVAKTGAVQQARA